jgi:hypothetical protein
MSAPPLRPANANVSRWQSEYIKVLARRSASRHLETKQVEAAKEPTATADNDVEIVTPAELRMLDFEEYTTIMDSEEEIVNEGIVEAAKEPIATADNAVEIVTPAKLRMLDFEESTTIMDSEENLMDEDVGIVEETTESHSHSAGEALREPIFIDLPSRKRRRSVGKNDPPPFMKHIQRVLTHIQQMIQDDLLSAQLLQAINVDHGPRLFKSKKEITIKPNQPMNPRHP